MTGTKLVTQALIIEDDADLGRALCIQVEQLGFVPTLKRDGPSGLATALANEYAFIVLDIMLPGLEGVDICRQLRSQQRMVPIIILTAAADETTKVLLLELGADDYLVKPFSERELKARIRTILRRTSGASQVEPPASFRYEELEIDYLAHQIRVAEKAIDLSPQEFALIDLLASVPGKVFTRNEINSGLYEYGIDNYDNSLNSRVNRIRAKLEADPRNPKFIVTVRGVGYRLGKAK